MQSLNSCRFKRLSVNRRRPRERPSQTPRCYIYSLFGSPHLSYSVLLCSVKPQPGWPTIVSSGVDGTAGASPGSLPPHRSRLELIYPGSWPTGAQVRLCFPHWMTGWLAELQQPVSCTPVSRSGPPAELAAVQSPVNRIEQETGCGRVLTFDTSCASHSVVNWKPVFPQCSRVMMVKASAPTSKQSKRQSFTAALVQKICRVYNFQTLMDESQPQ